MLWLTAQPHTRQAAPSGSCCPAACDWVKSIALSSSTMLQHSTQYLGLVWSTLSKTFVKQQRCCQLPATMRSRGNWSPVLAGQPTIVANPFLYAEFDMKTRQPAHQTVLARWLLGCWAKHSQLGSGIPAPRQACWMWLWSRKAPWTWGVHPRGQ